MRHVWETKDLGLPYYFTVTIVPQKFYVSSMWCVRRQFAGLPVVVVPSDAVRLLERENLLNNPDYLPADSTIRQAKLNAENLDIPNVHALPNSVISHDFYQDMDSEDDEKITQLARNNTTLTLTDDVILPARNNPLDAHELQRVQVGVGQVQGESDNATYATLDFKAGFGDLLDRPNGYPDFFDLNGASVGIKAYDDAEEQGRMM